MHLARLVVHVVVEEGVLLLSQLELDRGRGRDDGVLQAAERRHDLVEP